DMGRCHDGWVYHVSGNVLCVHSTHSLQYCTSYAIAGGTTHKYGWHGAAPTRAGAERHAVTPPSFAESRRQTTDQLAAPDDVGGEHRQCGQHHCRQHGRYAHRELALVRPQRQRQHPHLGALGEHQREEETVPYLQGFVDPHRHQRRPGQRQHQGEEHTPVPYAVDPHRLEQLAGDVPHEVDQDEHAD